MYTLLPATTALAERRFSVAYLKRRVYVSKILLPSENQLNSLVLFRFQYLT